MRIQEFLDMIAPSVIKFNTDHFICGNTYRCVGRSENTPLPLKNRPSSGIWEKKMASPCASTPAMSPRWRKRKYQQRRQQKPSE